MQFLSSSIRSKIDAYNGDVSASEFHKNIRFILLSAHDTTVAGLISAVGLGNEQTEITPLASMLLIEVYKRNGGLFVSWNYNGQRLRLGNNCNAEGDCDLYPTLDFFDSLVVSNLEQECKDMVELQTEVPIILYAFIIFCSVILILIFISIYCLCKISYNFYNDSKLSYQEFQDFNSNNYILEENSSKISKYDSNTHTVDSTNFNP